MLPGRAHAYRKGCSVRRVVVVVAVARPIAGGMVSEECEGLRVWCCFCDTLKMVTWDDQMARRCRHHGNDPCAWAPGDLVSSWAWKD